MEDNSKADVGGFKNIYEAVDKDFLCTRVRRTAHNVLCLILNSPPIFRFFNVKCSDWGIFIPNLITLTTINPECPYSKYD